jgi:ribosomal protein S18
MAEKSESPQTIERIKKVSAILEEYISQERRIKINGITDSRWKDYNSL